jgi:DNA-binding CsgD family transcriptional regulator/tetratricopeptide (TPR) repeat protein
LPDSPAASPGTGWHDTREVIGRVTSSRFVGRGPELAELRDALSGAATGRPSVLVVAGESGVGKTRLVAEAEAAAADDGVRVLHGGCVMLGESELPYGPLLDALRPLAREGDPALAELPRGARAELGRLLPDLAPGAEADGGGESAQLRLFEALLTLLERMGERAPVLLTLEDLHWADRSTRTFVAYLARALRTERVLVVGTYRPDELHRRHPVRALLSELERGSHTRRIGLEPLGRPELQELAADILGAPPPPDVADRLAARSEGNPLYLEELLAAGLDGRAAAPPTLGDALRVRMDRLGAEARDLLRTAAVGGRADEGLLGEVSGLGGRGLHDALREAVEGHVLVAEGDGTLAFRHALLREVAYDDLLPGERAGLHLAFARALERRCGPVAWDEDGLASTIAHHYMSGGDQPAALGAAVRAAGAAERVHAHGEAAALLERALELWPRVPDAAERAGDDRVGLLCRAARAHLWGGDRARAEVLLRAALDELEPFEDSGRAAEVLGLMARVQWALSRGGEAMDAARRAMALLPEDEPSTVRAGLLAWWAGALMLRGRYGQAVGAARQALDAADAAGDEPARGQALTALGVSLMARGKVDEGAEELRRALAIACDHERPEEVAEAHVRLADSLNLAGRTAEALETARTGLETVGAMLGRRHDGLALAVAEYATEAGDWALAAEHLPPEGTPFVGRALINAELRRGELALGRGDEGAAERLTAIEPLVAQSSEAPYHGAFGSLLSEARRREGDLEGARLAVAQALDRLEFCTDDVARIAQVAAAGVSAEADRAQRARDRREAAAVKEALARARSLMSRVRAAARPGGPVEKAWRATAEGELSRARGTSDAGRWAAAADAWEALGRPYPAAVARWREAEAHLDGGERAAAAESARAAMSAARRLGAGWLLDEVSGLAARGRLRLGEAPEESAAPPPPEEPFGLTPRERQVLALVAEGRTNREIGDELYMAEKTASVHVSRILAKLGVRSRGQAAAVAHRLGLEAPP